MTGKTENFRSEEEPKNVNIDLLILLATNTEVSAFLLDSACSKVSFSRIIISTLIEREKES